jgi:hypothetical protein
MLSVLPGKCCAIRDHLLPYLRWRSNNFWVYASVQPSRLICGFSWCCHLRKGELTSHGIVFPCAIACRWWRAAAQAKPILFYLRWNKLKPIFAAVSLPEWGLRYFRGPSTVESFWYSIFFGLVLKYYILFVLIWAKNNNVKTQVVGMFEW